MRRWVITGPAGAGKSVLALWLAEKGAVIIDADGLGHELLARPEIQAAIVSTFGSDFVRDGAVDRAALGQLVFGDPEQLDRLNALMHPPLAVAIADRFAKVEAGGGTDLAVLEAAVYFLLPPTVPMDMTIAVVARERTREQRLVAGRGLKPEEARRRVVAQRSLDRFWSRADLVLENDDSVADLRRRAEDALAKQNPAGEE